jgi:hypothetical protein
MIADNAYPYCESQNVLPDSKLNVPDPQVPHISGRRITGKTIEDLALEKYRSCGKGITFEDVQRRFSLRKAQVQRSLKHFHMRRVIFTAWDLNTQGINLIENTNPQQYFPSCIKADIIEDLKKRSKNVQVHPTVYISSINGNALSNVLESQKAQTFLDVLIQLPFAQLHIHRLQLTLSIGKEYYQILTSKAAPMNRAKRHEEHIGRRHVTYTFSPNGRVELAIRSSDTPFKLETDEDEAILFSFFGQVRDRLIHIVADIREREIPEITEWILKGCDLNRDVEIDEKAQLHLPDIQLKHADQVFRMYVKSLHDKVVWRGEKSLTLDLPLPRALDSITMPVRAIKDLTNMVLQLGQKIDSLSKQ